MFRHNPAYPFSPYDEEYTDLEFGLQSRDYPRIYAALKQTPSRWEPSLAFRLANLALSCTPCVLKAVLEHCPQLETPSCRTQSGGPYAFALGYSYSLMAAAAFLGRPDQMRFLYSRGFPLNEEDGIFTSPLEAALAGIWSRVDPDVNSFMVQPRPGALDLLLRDPDLTCAVPYKLAPWWARMGMDPAFDRCLTRVARRLFPELKAKGGLPPLLPALDVTLAYSLENPGLIRRLFRERPPALDELRAFFRSRTIDTDLADELLICMLEESLTLYPQLLRSPRVRCLLLTMYLGGSSAAQQLEPWVTALEGKRIPLLFCGLPYLGADGVLPRWSDKLGDRITPVLNRNRDLPCSSGSFSFDGCWFGGEEAPGLEQFLRYCQVTGKPPRDRVSTLGKLAVQTLPIPRLVEALRPDGLLDCEDPSALLTLAGDPELDRERVAALLANVKHGEEGDPYEL